MTDEAEKLLRWIESRGRVTRTQVVMLGCPEYRRLRRLCLDELIELGYVVIVDGWLCSGRTAQSKKGLDNGD